MAVTRGEDALRVRALTFDPGTANLGAALVVYDGQHGDPHCDLHYHVRWWALWDLNARRGSDGSRASQLEGLLSVVLRTPVVAALLGDPAVRVYIEHQEGFDFARPELGAALMPMCTVAGALYALFRLHGHPTELVGKQSKWGWTSYQRTDGYARLSEAKKRERRKYCITLYVRDLIARQAANAEVGAAGLAVTSFGTPHFFRCAAGHAMQDRFDALKFDDQAHMCDAVVQAMHALRKLFRVSAPNTIREADAPRWPALAAEACAAVPAPPPANTSRPSPTCRTYGGKRPRPRTGTARRRAARPAKRRRK